MTSISDVKQAEIIETFNSTSRYLDDLLNIDNPYLEGMVNRILGWLYLCFTALRHILGHFGRGQLT